MTGSLMRLAVDRLVGLIGDESPFSDADGDGDIALVGRNQRHRLSASD